VKGKPMMNRKSDEQIDFRCSRRDFFKNTMAGFGKIAIWSFTVPIIKGCSSLGSETMGSYAPGTPGGDRPSITVDISRTENQALLSVGGTLALGVSDIDWKGILLYRESETTVKAYSRECTHQQCTIRPFINGVSSCPCHLSNFNLSGDKISGPAPRALYQYKTSVNGNIITIDS
jgi:Rieske Fe-S protein